MEKENNVFLHNQLDFIKYPIITEKSTGLFENNQYTFIVDRRINKVNIKAAIEYLFGVRVIKVNTCLLPKKQKRIGKFRGYKTTYKKAIIKLEKGNKIEVFPEM